MLSLLFIVKMIKTSVFFLWNVSNFGRIHLFGVCVCEMLYTVNYYKFSVFLIFSKTKPDGVFVCLYIKFLRLTAFVQRTYSIPGDSKWPFHPLVGGHQQALKGSLNHPKKVTKNLAGTHIYIYTYYIYIYKLQVYLLFGQMLICSIPSRQ